MCLFICGVVRMSVPVRFSKGPVNVASNWVIDQWEESAKIQAHAARFVASGVKRTCQSMGAERIGRDAAFFLVREV